MQVRRCLSFCDSHFPLLAYRLSIVARVDLQPSVRTGSHSGNTIEGLVCFPKSQQLTCGNTEERKLNNEGGTARLLL